MCVCVGEIIMVCIVWQCVLTCNCIAHPWAYILTAISEYPGHMIKSQHQGVNGNILTKHFDEVDFVELEFY